MEIGPAKRSSGPHTTHTTHTPHNNPHTNTIGPNSVWAQRGLGPTRSGPSAVWAQRGLGPARSGPSAVWAQRGLGPTRSGPNAVCVANCTVVRRISGRTPAGRGETGTRSGAREGPGNTEDQNARWGRENSGMGLEPPDPAAIEPVLIGRVSVQLAIHCGPESLCVHNPLGHAKNSWRHCLIHCSCEGELCARQFFLQTSSARNQRAKRNDQEFDVLKMCG